MKILVCVKQVRLRAEEVKILDDASDLTVDSFSAAMNEWDAFAIEAALQLKELTEGETVTATCGPPESDVVARRCLAMGADRAIRIEGAKKDPYSVARALASIVMSERPSLVLCGAQSSDWAQAATGSALAGLIGWPVVAVVTNVRVGESPSTVVVDRELERKVIHRIAVDLPAVLTIQTGINTPRHPTLRQIKQAERKPIEVRGVSDDELPAYRVKRMWIAPHQHRAEPLGTDAAEVASRIASLVKGHVRA